MNIHGARESGGASRVTLTGIVGVHALLGARRLREGPGRATGARRPHVVVPGAVGQRRRWRPLKHTKENNLVNARRKVGRTRFRSL